MSYSSRKPLRNVLVASLVVVGVASADEPQAKPKADPAPARLVSQDRAVHAVQETRPADVPRSAFPPRPQRSGRYRGYPPALRYYAPFGAPAPYDVQRALDEAYTAGRLDERDDARRRFNVADMDRRKERLLSKHQQALFAGIRRLKSGDHRRAVVAFTLASRLNNGDPASRLHLAQARVALGHYAEAGKVLRRALQLQPHLVYMDLHLDRYYENDTDLKRYTARLADHVAEHGAKSETYFLLGYLRFQTGDFNESHAAFRTAAGGLPDDDLTRSYLEITKPASEK